MLLTKANLSIANLAPKEQSRYVLNGILVEPDYTVVTDGHLLVVVQAATAIKSEDFPSIDETPEVEQVDEKRYTKPLGTFEPFILARGTALEVAKAIPIKQTIPALEHAAIARRHTKDESRAGEGFNTIYTTDLETHRVFHARHVPGNYPNWRIVIPRASAATGMVRVGVDLLQNLLSNLKKIGVENVVIRSEDKDKALRLDGVTDTAQHVTAVLMPMHLEATEPPPPEYTPEPEKPVEQPTEPAPKEEPEPVGV